MEQYFIFVSGKKTGPFDLVSMIKKIRNHRLDPHDSVMTDEMEDAVEAWQIEVLATYFAEREAPHLESAAKLTGIENLDLIELLKKSWDEYEGHQPASIFVAIGCVFTLTLTLMLSAILPAIITVLLTSALSGSLIFVLMVFMSYRLNGKEITEDFAHSLRSPRGINLVGAGALLGALCFGVPLLAWSFIGPLSIVLLVAGFLAFSLFLLTPLMWADPTQEEFSVANLMGQSKNWVLSQDMDTIGKLLTIFTLNAFASLLFLLPVFFSLPVTIIAWNDLYEHYYKS